MIISRTPFRVSFFGGGTDLPSFYEKEGGRVLSCAIDKYLYVVVKRQLGIVESKFRINWAEVELADSVDEIRHVAVRETLRYLNIDFPLEITTFAEVPPNTGLGSSSTFGVGLLHALHALSGRYVSKAQLAREASEIEIEIMQSPIGRQDHYAASYGNLNSYVFNNDHTVNVEPVLYSKQILSELEASLVMFYTKVKRPASELLKEQQKRTMENIETLINMRDQVEPMRQMLSKEMNYRMFGDALDKGWQLKRSQTPLISTPEIDDFYQKAINAGATGGKLLGAGGGGFLLFCVEPENRSDLKAALSPLYELPFKIDLAGTRITYYDPMSN